MFTKLFHFFDVWLLLIGFLILVYFKNFLKIVPYTSNVLLVYFVYLMVSLVFFLPKTMAFVPPTYASNFLDSACWLFVLDLLVFFMMYNCEKILSWIF